MIEGLIEIADQFLRIIGWLVAAGGAAAVAGSSIVILVSLFNIHFFKGGLLNKALALLLPGPVAAIYLVCVWRVVRFAGGYAGSSAYPLQHVVRTFL